MDTIFFFDDYYIDEVFKMSLYMNYPQKHEKNPVISKNFPWEGTLCAYGSFLADENIYRAYYTMWWLDTAEPYSCLEEGIVYAYSKNGIDWEKPDLNMIQGVNEGHNNLIHYNKFADQPCVLKLPDEINGNRYVMAYYGDFQPLGAGVRICYSKDGIHWGWPGELVWKTPIDSIQDQCDFYAADDTISFFYDPYNQKYVLFRKVMYYDELVYDPAKHVAWLPNKDRLQRVIARCESHDLVHWENHRLVLKPDLNDTVDIDFHRFSCTPYAGQYIGLLEMHQTEANKKNIEIALLYSRDGYQWVRPCRSQQPFIPRGGENEWDGGVAFVTSPFIVKEKEVDIFYGGMQARLTADSLALCDKFGIGNATIPRDRFISLRSSGHETGYLLTRPLQIEEKIYINSVVHDNGFLEVALYDLSGMPVPGFEWHDCDIIKGDSVRCLVSWKGQYIPSSGVYRLHIRSKGSDLFALYTV